VKELIARTKSNISVSQVHDYYPNTSSRIVIVSGTLSAVSFSQSLICIRTARLAKNDTPDEDRYTSLEALQQAPEDVMQHYIGVKISIPELAAGLLIGRSGEFVKMLSGQAGASVKFSETVTMSERLVHIDGPCVSCIVAVNLILEKMVSEPRMGRYGNYNASYTVQPPPQQMAVGGMPGRGGFRPTEGAYPGQMSQVYGYGQMQGFGQYPPQYGQQYHQQYHQYPPQQPHYRQQHGPSGYPYPQQPLPRYGNAEVLSPHSSTRSESPSPPLANLNPNSSEFRATSPSSGTVSVPVHNPPPVPGVEVISTVTTMVVSVAAGYMAVMVAPSGAGEGRTVLDDIIAGTNVTITHTNFTEINVSENIPCNVTITGSRIGVQSAHNLLVEKCRECSKPAPIAAELANASAASGSEAATDAGTASATTSSDGASSVSATA
jgi:hypothetical protein